MINLANYISIGAKPYFGTKSTGLYGVWQDTLQTAELIGLVYNSTGKYVELLEDVWKDRYAISVWDSSTVFVLKYVASMEKGLLWKNDVLIDDDQWRWNDETHIELLNGVVYQTGDVWEISYELKKEIITPAIHTGIVAVAKSVQADGYIFQKYSGNLKDFTVTESIKFDSSLTATLQLGWSAVKQGALRTKKGRVVVGWSWADSRTIVIQPYEFNPADEYELEYSATWEWTDVGGVDTFVCYSTDNVSWAAWEAMVFQQELKRYAYYKLRVRFREQVKAGAVRVRSLVIKVRDKI